MEQFVEDGELSTLNPAIVRERGGAFSYESTLINGGQVVIDLASGFGGYTPEAAADIADCAAALAAEYE